MDKTDKTITCFSYNSKNGCLYANDKYIVYCEKSGDTYYFFIKLGRKRRYLESSELKQLADAAQWFIEHQGSNFGEPIQNLLSKYGH